MNFVLPRRSTLGVLIFITSWFSMKNGTRLESRFVIRLGLGYFLLTYYYSIVYVITILMR